MTDQADAQQTTESATDSRCAHCGERLPTAQLLALHRGLAHYEALSARERAAFETARAAERTELRRVRLQAVAGLVVVYFGLLLAYAVFA